MSALELTPLTAVSERRGSDRTRLDRVLHALVGRNNGIFVDLSMRGAKIRHEGAVRRGASVRLVFLWERDRFSATAEGYTLSVVEPRTEPGEDLFVEFRITGPDGQPVGELDEVNGVILAGVVDGFSTTPPDESRAEVHIVDDDSPSSK